MNEGFCYSPDVLEELVTERLVDSEEPNETQAETSQQLSDATLNLIREVTGVSDLNWCLPGEVMKVRQVDYVSCHTRKLKLPKLFFVRRLGLICGLRSPTKVT